MEMRVAWGEHARRRRTPLSTRHDDAAGLPNEFAKVLFYQGHLLLLPLRRRVGPAAGLSGCFESLFGLLAVKANAL
jgi:hypothetical protein